MAASKTLAERVTEPGFKAAVDRHRAKLDAEEAGWVVLEPKRARALLLVARAARMHSHAECAYDPIDESRFCGICRALAALDKAGASGARSRKGER